MSQSHLEAALFLGWRRGLFGNCSENVMGACKSFDCRRVGEGLLGRGYGVEQLLWFENFGNGLNFNVLTNTEIADAADKVNEAIDTRTAELTRTRQEVYRSLFGRPRVELLDKAYDGSNHTGVVVAARIIEVPSAGRASELFVDYAYNMLALPPMTAVWAQPISGREWRSLFPRKG